MAPTARRRRHVDEDEPDQPRRRRRVPEDEEGEPRHRRPEPDEDDNDVEEAPRRRRSKASADEDDGDQSSRRPRGGAGRGPGGRAGRRPASTRSERRVASGWGGHKEVATRAGRDDMLQLGSEPQLIKVLENEPFAAYRQHWIPKRNRSFMCLKPVDGACPLCDIGDKPNSSKTLFNIVEMSNPEKVLVWAAGAIAASELEDAADDDRFKGLSDPKLYFEVYAKKRNDKTEHKVSIVRARDLAEDWDVEPLTVKDIDALNGEMFDEEFVRIPTQDELEEVADEIA